MTESMDIVADVNYRFVRDLKKTGGQSWRQTSTTLGGVTGEVQFAPQRTQSFANTVTVDAWRCFGAILLSGQVSRAASLAGG